MLVDSVVLLSLQLLGAGYCTCLLITGAKNSY